MRAAALALWLLLSALFAPALPAQDPDESIWCHDADRKLVTRTPRWRCKYEVVSEARAEAIKAERVRRLQRMMRREQEPLLPGRKLKGTGSGFFITHEGHVLTNHHVVQGCGAVTITPPDGEERIARSGIGNRQSDLAIVRTDFEVERPARFRGPQAVPPGTEVHVVGYPLHGKVLIKPRMVSGRVRPAANARHTGVFAMTIDVRRGNSGGPVLDAYGRVAGVVVAKVNTPGIYAKTGKLVRNIGFAITLDRVRRFAARNKITLLRGDSAQALPEAQRMARARDFVVQVRCWTAQRQRAKALPAPRK